MKTGHVSIADALEMIGVPVKELRRRLWEAHKKHGNILFRSSGAKNGKLWTTPAALRKAFPERLSDDVPDLDVLELRAITMKLERRLDRVERKVGTK